MSLPMESKFINQKAAARLLGANAQEFVIIQNPDYVYPEIEITPMAKKITGPVDHLVAAVMDMDGTTTTTETLCIHSLEYMVRRISNRPDKKVWKGLDERIDYPHIIGNSTTRHVEYLIEKYKSHIDRTAFRSSYLAAAIWFLVYGKDPNRVREVQNNLTNLGCKELLQDKRLRGLISRKEPTTGAFKKAMDDLMETFVDRVSIRSRTDQVRAAIDVYYQRYHEILGATKEGQGNQLAEQLLGRKSHAHLIEPMPGIAEFIALIKGWLGEEAPKFYPALRDQLAEKLPETVREIDTEKAKIKLQFLGRHFQINPLKIAIVTSSIQYEADIVLGEVFRVITEQIEKWPVSTEKKAFLQQKFSDYQHIYDGFVTATDSSEIRLKPHRDLYSLALHQLGIPKEQFHQVMGFEDSESGTIAIRTAGIGLCLAVPFSETQHHDFTAASFILKGGLPETILKYNVFLK